MLNKYSVSGNENDFTKLIEKRLSKNFVIRQQKVNKNFNLLAFKGKPRIIFASHSDTVPEKLRVKKLNGFIYGRGACDTKAQTFAGIIAIEKALKNGLTDFGLMLTVQEETDFAGAKKALELIPKTTQLVIVGEPTGFKAIIGQKGLITVKISAKGRAVHGSTPEKGINAIELLLEDLVNIKKIKITKNNKLGESSLNIGTISGGTAPNVVPNYAEAIIEIRATTDTKKIISQIKRVTKNSTLKILNCFEPKYSLASKNISKSLGLETKIFPAFTEQYFYMKKTKTIVLGVNEFGMHAKNEKVKITDIEELSKIYYNILSKFCKT